MKTDKLEQYLDELSDGTDFTFSISEVKNREVELVMDGYNPEGEDWREEITIKNPKTKKELRFCIKKCGNFTMHLILRKKHILC